MGRSERVSRRLKLRQLEILMAVSQSGSMVKAAEQLAITQPVVSKSISDLESTLGVRLFDRTTQGIEPTHYGTALIQRSIGIFNDLRISVNELEHLADPTSGDLRIGSSETVAAGLLGLIIQKLTEQHPRLTFEVTLGGDLTQLPHHDLRARNIDLVIGRLPAPIPADMEAIVLYDDRLFVVAGTQNPLTRRSSIKLAELISEPWCGAPFDSFPWSLVRDAFLAERLEIPRNVVRTRSILARNGLLASGRFLTLLPTTMLHFGAQNFSLKPLALDLPIPSYPVGIITLKGRTITPVAQLFINFARQVSQPLARTLIKK